MTQIILLDSTGDSVILPETSNNKYACPPEDLTVQVTMASKRIVLESRGKVYKPSYSYDYMGNELQRKALAILRSGVPFTAYVLPDDRDEMYMSRFITLSVDRPTMAFSRKDQAYWHHLGFELREERPHG